MAERTLSANLAFSQDLLTDIVVAPHILLTKYELLAIDERELVVLLRLLHVSGAGGWISSAAIAAEFACSEEEARAVVEPFSAKGLLKYDAATDGFSSEYLFRRLYEEWMAVKRQNGGKPARADKAAKSDKARDKAAIQLRDATLKELYHCFEQEMGTMLSPMENDKIRHWLEDEQLAPELIKEALKRSVLQGKRNFAYIDKILLNWRKKHYATIEDVAAEDAPSAAAAKPRGKAKARVGEDKFADVYLKMLK
ncbi:MAG: DnaD domain protein [Bacillota bacterium]|nr:DnaD domain protein [Bacillota bacterium]